MLNQTTGSDLKNRAVSNGILRREASVALPPFAFCNANARCCCVPKTTVSEKIIRAKRIKPHSDIVGTVAAPKEQAAGAKPALLLLRVQLGVAEKKAVSARGCPFDSIVTPVKVCVTPTKEPTATVPAPLPVRVSVPLPGGLEKLTVTLAVKVSSAELAGVPLLLQVEILVTVMPLTEQTAAVEQAAGAVPAALLVSVQVGSAEKAAVRLMALPSALIVTPVKVCVPAPKVPTAAEAVPSPVRVKLPLAGGLAKVTVTLAVKVSSAVLGVP